MILVVFFKINILNACGSLGPGSGVGEKGKKRGQTGKISAREASPAVARGDYLSEPIFFRLRRFFFPFSLNAEPGPWLPVRL